MKTKALLLLFLSLSTYSSENDSFTHRYEPLEDSTAFFNTYMNKKLDEVVKKANKFQIDGCSHKVLMGAAKNRLVANIEGGFVFSPTQLMIKDKKSKGFEKRKMPMEKSIYKHVKAEDAPVLKMFTLSPTINLVGSIIGSDKFSHFFNLGYEYYQDSKKKDLQEILKNGKKAESNFWGGPTTGVISYSDLAANFQGMRFFGHLSARGKDPLTGRDNLEYAYVKCVNEKWKRVRDFDWSEYFSSDVDEGINCSVYYTDKVKAAVEKSLRKLAENGKNYSCPVVAGECEKALEKYGELSRYLVSPHCY